jgi:hypothetical protein
MEYEVDYKQMVPEKMQELSLKKQVSARDTKVTFRNDLKNKRESRKLII